jgi:hypothetical protein
MWFAEQLNSFLTLGKCKEYPIMARKKVDKPNSINKEQTTNNPAPASVPVARAEVVETKAAAKVEANSAPAGKMFEVRKPEARRNVRPINLEEEIRRRAYELFEQRGAVGGSEADDWLSAEREVMQRYHQQSA